jgi:hypothetical protein
MILTNELIVFMNKLNVFINAHVDESIGIRTVFRVLR